MKSLSCIALAFALSACGGPSNPSLSGTRVVSVPDSANKNRVRALTRDLEATLLENYSHLSLGNMDAFIDSIAPGRPVALIGLGAKELWESNSTDDRRPFPNLNGEFSPKNLSVELSSDAELGWVVDESPMNSAASPTSSPPSWNWPAWRSLQICLGGA